MIKRIVRIDGIGLFRRWQPGSDSSNFERINVVYGGNGTGKSSVARAFGEATAASSASTVHVSVEDGDRLRQVTSSEDPFWTRVRVFNQDYVENNLSFGTDRSEAAPLLVLGQKSVGRETRLAQIAERLEIIESEERLAVEDAGRARNAADRLATATATTIHSELQHVSARYGRAYNRRQVKTLLDALPTRFDEPLDEVISTHLGTVRPQKMEPVSLLTITGESVVPLVAEVGDALATSVSNVVLDDLAAHPEDSTWVSEGVSRHEQRDRCLFCGGVVTDERRGALAAHFDGRFRQLERTLDMLDGRVAAVIAAQQGMISRAPAANLLYPPLRESYGELLAGVREATTSRSEALDAVRRAIETKRSAMFDVVTFDPGVVDGQSDDVAAINLVLRDHNERSAAFESIRADAADRVERARVELIRSEYVSLSERALGAEQQAADHGAEREQLTRERGRLNSAGLDAGPLASELTRDVAVLLGRDELRFTAVDGRYAIERDGRPAVGLSEGERTAISLLHFLCSLRDETMRGADLTVVIDDPVSSLDQEIMVGVSGHLWNTFVGAGIRHQLILLTHSFELFRMWVNQLDRLHSRLRRDNSYSLHELRSRVSRDAEDVPRRVPVLRSWSDPQLRKKLRSQYHYLFWRVGSAVLERNSGTQFEAELEAAALLPNAARRLLESFLAFRLPVLMGDFEGSMRTAFDEHQIEQPLRQRLVRFLHQSSHSEEADISRPVDVHEAVVVLESVFRFIAAVDRPHFEQMCAAVVPGLSYIGAASVTVEPVAAA
ncbi:AAA family ATPase [Curtobacterium sp. NPDC087082]|uniref:AAA family ATPase n=1 Tax=Curtobacterium subtropicum TaxID=3055138 RepID=A0ABT7TFG3_9MICO|nr:MULTISPECIES: AAA family ATPase [Curtobacterium]MDM7888318.1 AAA family ATPase [Curtobacterium subtropicum]SBN63193.1 Wobble nucleotide-excising tRNase [Curtobacterium sp. 9128]